MPNKPDQDQARENNSIRPIARHHARHYALQAMYQWQMTKTPVDVIEAEFLQYHIEKKFDLDYFKELIHGVPEHQKEIDAEMTAFLGRPLHDIDPVELSVLRIATYELMKRPDVPYRVIINEALELAKKFGSVEGYKFVNGVLDRVARKNRKTEIEMRRK